MPAGWVKAKPSAAPRKGAVQGVARMVASTPLKNAPAGPCFDAKVPAVSMTRPPGLISKRPKRFSATRVTSAVRSDQELRVAELHAPAGFVSGGLDANDQARQHEEGHQHTERVDQAQPADPARIILGLADEAENLQGDDGQDAGHDVQNQPAEESVEQHLPKRRSDEAGER